MSRAPELLQPKDLESAVEQLSLDDEAMSLSGGATLVALLNANLVEPTQLISLKEIEELIGIEKLPDGSIKIGAMTHHAMTAYSEMLVGSLSGIREAASKIANPTVRNMGTMGGSIAFADPGADYPPALVAADAEIEIVSLQGARRIKAEEFFVDWYETALEPGELIKAIYLPKINIGACGIHEKFARVEGDFATVSVNVVLAIDENICRSIRVAVGACGPTPVRNPEAEDLLIGKTLSEENLLVSGELLANACDPVDDVRGSASYRLSLVPQLLVKAVTRAQHTLIGTGKNG